MKKLTYLTILVFGLLLGTITAYFTLQHVIATRGGMGMHGFVDKAHQALQQAETLDMLICSKLAMDNGKKIDNMRLNLTLNQALQALDNGEMRAFYILVYVKGYAFGMADSMLDKQAAFEQYRCKEQFPWLIQ